MVKGPGGKTSTHLRTMKLFSTIAEDAFMDWSFISAPPVELRSYLFGIVIHWTKTGSRLIKRMISEKLCTSFEVNQPRIQADRIDQSRHANVMRNVNSNNQRHCNSNASVFGSNTTKMELYADYWSREAWSPYHGDGKLYKTRKWKQGALASLSVSWQKIKTPDNCGNSRFLL